MEHSAEDFFNWSSRCMDVENIPEFIGVVREKPRKNAIVCGAEYCGCEAVQRP